MSDVTKVLDEIKTAFEEYKTTNDARLDAIKKGNSTSDFDAKLAKMDDALNKLEEQKSELEKLQTKLSRPGNFDSTKRIDDESKEQAEYRAAFMSWVRNPSDLERHAALQQRSKLLAGVEQRAVQTVTSTGSAGGFALPEIIERQIARLSVDISPIRQLATVRTVGSSDYKELFDINGAAFEWVGEAGTRNQSNTPDLAEVVPTMGTASSRPRASEESLDDLFFDVENWLVTSAAEAMAQGEGAAFVSGNGTNRPTGFLQGPTPVTTADATRAFGTLQFTPSGQAAALPTSADIFYDVVYALRARYRANATWVTSKLVLAALRKYKDTTNQYLWQPNVAAGQPSTFMGFPVVEAEDMPAVAANAFSVAFGDFREGYLIADRVGMRITRDEITLPGFVQFYIRKRVGGRIRNSQAIKLLRISTT
jgi:HK97 family phage major capsid protein